MSARHDIVDAQCQRDMWAHCVSEPCQWDVQVSWVWVLCQSVTINLLQSVCDNQSVTINLLQSVCGNRPHTDARGLWQSVCRTWSIAISVQSGAVVCACVPHRLPHACTHTLPSSCRACSVCHPVDRSPGPFMITWIPRTKPRCTRCLSMSQGVN